MSGVDALLARLNDWLCSVGEPACMGGYGSYVWISIGVTVVVLIVNAWLPWRAHRALMTQIANDLNDQRRDAARAEQQPAQTSSTSADATPRSVS